LTGRGFRGCERNDLLEPGPGIIIIIIIIIIIEQIIKFLRDIEEPSSIAMPR
jgi:hypothetical protein